MQYDYFSRFQHKYRYMFFLNINLFCISLLSHAAVAVVRIKSLLIAF